MRKLFRFIFKTVLVITIMVIGLVAYVVIRNINKDDKQTTQNVIDSNYEYNYTYEESDSEVIEVEQEQTEEPEAEVQEEQETKEEAVDNNGIRPEFKKSMEDYEAFFDEYIEFMNEYKKDSTSLAMIAKYSEFLIKYEKAMSELGNIDESELTEAEDKLFLETQLRINNKLAEAAINY